MRPIPQRLRHATPPARRRLARMIVPTVVLAAAALSGCGVVYTEPRISAAATLASANGVGVEVVPITLETVGFANAEAYQPRSLPPAFAPIEDPALGAPHLRRMASPTPMPTTADGGPMTIAFDGGARGAAVLQPTPPAILAPVSAEAERRLPPPLEPSPYRIGAGDVLTVSFAGAASQTGDSDPAARIVSARVKPSGAIVIPDIGLVQVGGLTLDEVQTELLEQLARRRIDREAAVDIAGFNSQSVAIAGAVVAPSVKPITLSGLSLDEAIASSGGLDRVDPRFGMIVLNRDGESYLVPVQDYQANAWVRQLVLKDGDSLFVDRRYDADAARAFFQDRAAERAAMLTERQIAQAEQQAELSRRSFNFQAEAAARQDARAAALDQRERFQRRLDLGAEPRDYVYVGGEVGKQQRLAMPFDGRLTLADALFSVDGVRPITGDPSEIYVVRRPLAGDPAEDRLTAFHLNAGNAAYLSLATLFELRPSDVVFVESQPISEWNRILTQALPFLTAADTGIGIGAD